MLVFGRVSNVNYDDYTAKLQVDEFDNFETPWLVVLQLWTAGNKTGYMPEINTVAAAILNDDMTEGVILGAMYNKTDAVLSECNGNEFVKFSDGVTVSHTPNSNTLEITAENLIVNGNIVCSGDVSDKAGTIQSIRDWANPHTHSNGNNGADTGAPTSEIP